MLDEEKEVITVDCNECKGLCSIPLSPECRKCVKDKEFERVILKSRYLDKEYDKNGRLVNIRPFFIDVKLGLLNKKAKLLEEYSLETGAKVQILERDDNVGFEYHIKIPENNQTLYELIKFRKKVDEFQDTEHTDDDIVRRWYLENGILEHLMFDKNVLEININPPPYTTPMRIVHSKYDEGVV
jgi:hypothetical protein